MYDIQVSDRTKTGWGAGEIEWTGILRCYLQLPESSRTISLENWRSDLELRRWLDVVEGYISSRMGTKATVIVDEDPEAFNFYT